MIDQITISTQSTMTPDEARACLGEISGAVRTTLHHLKMAAQYQAEARAAAKRFREAQGWLALGYDNLRECIDAESDMTWQHFYKLIRAAHIDDALSLVDGEQRTLPITHANELAKLETPQDQHAAYTEAQHLAAYEQRPVTAETIKGVVERIRSAQEAGGKYAPLGHMARTGDLPAAKAIRMAAILDKAKPVTRGTVLKMIVEHTITNVELVEAFCEMADREGSAKPSETWANILEDGNVAGTPLHEANMSDLRRAREDAQGKYILEGSEKNAEQADKPVIVTLWLNNPLRSAKALKKALGADLYAVLEALSE